MGSVPANLSARTAGRGTVIDLGTQSRSSMAVTLGAEGGRPLLASRIDPMVVICRRGAMAYDLSHNSFSDSGSVWCNI